MTKLSGHAVLYCQKSTNRGTLCPNIGLYRSKRT